MNAYSMTVKFGMQIENQKKAAQQLDNAKSAYKGHFKNHSDCDKWTCEMFNDLARAIEDADIDLQLVASDLSDRVNGELSEIPFPKTREQTWNKFYRLAGLR